MYWHEDLISKTIIPSALLLKKVWRIELAERNKTIWASFDTEKGLQPGKLLNCESIAHLRHTEHKSILYSGRVNVE